MNTHNKRLALVAAAVALALPGTAPGGDNKEHRPASSSPGGLAAVLSRRDKLPRSSPPAVSKAVMRNGAVVLTRQVHEYVPVAREFTVNVVAMVPVTEEYEVKVGDRTERRTRTVYRPVNRQEKRVATVTQTALRTVQQTVAVNVVKAFVVTREGKLEALDGGKLSDRLRKPTAVLIGDSAEVDPRHLGLIRPGTLYLSLPPAGPVRMPESGQPREETIPPPRGAT